MAHPVDIKILYWNANGISRDLHEFYNYLDRHSVDVALVYETFLKHDSKINSNCDYTLHRLDRTTGPRGGVGIFIKKTIHHNVLPHFGTKLIEALGIEIQTTTSKISLITAYLPGGASNQQIVSHYLNDLHLLQNRHESYFICGDFNSRHRLWNCARANNAGTILYNELVQSDFLIFHPPTPTYCPLSDRKTYSTIDLVITNGRHNISQPICVDAFASDHMPVAFEIQTDSVNTEPPGSIYCYKNANWPLFMSNISRNIELAGLSMGTITTQNQIDDMVCHLTTTITTAKEIAVPKINPKKYKLELPADVTDLITFRNFCRRHWTNNNNRDTNLKKFINRTTKKIQKKIQNLRYAGYGQMLSTFEGKPNKLWRVSKLLRKGNRFLPPLKVGSEMRLTAQGKAEAIAQSLSNVYNTSNRISPLEAEVTASITEIQNSVLDPINPEMLATPTEIKNYIKSLKSTKSPGIDGVNNRLLKQLPRKGIVYLTHIVNACLNIAYFPKTWKKASVIPILKPGKDPSNPSSYRPISLLSSIGKILERVILRRFRQHVSENHLFLDEQFGFREKHSTSHQLFRVVTDVRRGLRNRESTAMTFLDVEKAFDAVWHNGVLHKMFITNFPMRMTKLIQSFLSDRSFYVTVGDGKSESRSIPSGVPQGAVLSPTIYNFFTHDFPTLQDAKIALFADDTAIYCTSDDPDIIMRDLQAALNKTAEYFSKWKIKINATKTQSVFFTRRRTRGLPTSNLTLDGESIEWSDEAKYLGVTLDKKLTFKSHTQKTIEKIQKLIRVLYPLINRRSKLDKKNKILTYKAIFSAIMLYASPAWDACALSHLRLLQIQQNKCLKMILNLHWTHSTSDVHDRAKVPMLKEAIDKRRERFLNRIIFLENPLFDSPR
jgi:hypothetical protein